MRDRLGSKGVPLVKKKEKTLGGFSKNSCQNDPFPTTSRQEVAALS